MNFPSSFSLNQKITFLLLLFLLNSCVGTDVIADFVEERLEIANDVQVLALGTTHIFQASFLNNIGAEEQQDILWTSTNPNVISINPNTGLAEGKAIGTTLIIASIRNDEFNTADTLTIDVRSSIFEINEDISILGLGETHQFTATFMSFLGDSTTQDIVWSSSDPDIISIDAKTGLARGLATRTANIIASINSEELNLSDTIRIEVKASGTETILFERTGALQGSGGYALSGDMKLKENGDGSLIFSFADNFSFSGAPGPYLYLSNNPNSIANALEIGKLPTTRNPGTGAFEVGEIRGTNLNEYNYLVFWCKPFQVKLGSGELDNPQKQ